MQEHKEVGRSHSSRWEELENNMYAVIKKWEGTMNDMVYTFQLKVIKLENRVEEIEKKLSDSHIESKEHNLNDCAGHGPTMPESGVPPLSGAYHSGEVPHLQHEYDVPRVHAKQEEAIESANDLSILIEDNSNMTTTCGTRIHQRSMDEQLHPPQGRIRAFICAGDSTIARFARTLVDRVGDHRRVQILFTRDRPALEVHHLFDDCRDGLGK